VPDPQARETFEASVLRWDELSQEPHARLLDWHRRLIALRRSLPPVDFDDVDVRYDEDERWLVLHRGPVSVVCNLSGERRRVLGLDGDLLLASDAAVAVGNDSVTLPAESVAVLGR
jgi:maltooligosyltrehalose trehalohydrolase